MVHVRLRAGDDVRALWVFAMCVLIAGLFYVHRRYQTAISASYERTEALYRETLADTRIVREADRLRVVQKRAQADLRRVSHDTSISATTAALLSTLQSSAHAFNARILEVQPGAVEPPANKSLEATGLTIRVRGAFRDLLGFVEDLSHHSTLVSVTDTELTLANRGQADAAEPSLDATIHAKLYRLIEPGEKSGSVAATR